MCAEVKKMTGHGNPGKQCCPPFDPATLDGKTHVWDNKLFFMESVPQVFHLPLPWVLGRTIGRMWERAQAVKAAPAPEDFLLLTYDRSPWRAEWYLAVTAPVPGTEPVRLSGTFVSRVFEGPYSSAPKWMRAMEEYAAARGERIRRQYFYYPTCPKCARMYGRNYAVAFAQVERDT